MDTPIIQKIKRPLCLFIIVLLQTGQYVLAQSIKADEDSLGFFKRLSFSTNAIDWMLATPGLAVELDMSGSTQTRYSILLNGKYNWNTSHSVSPRLVYNMASFSVEGRKYWRTGGVMRNPETRYTRENRDTTISLPRWGFQRFRRNVLSGRTFTDPRTWRAYYIGIYVGYEKFTFSTGGEGKQGDSFNFGLSGGWSMPLYPFRNGRSLDLDLGFSLGTKYVAYDSFKYNEEFGCYVYSGPEKRHFVPYPVLQEIRLAFVFRFRSIGRKVKGGAERYQTWRLKQQTLRAERERIRGRNWEMRDSMLKVRHQEKVYEQEHKDSLRRVQILNDSLESLTKEIQKSARKHTDVTKKTEKISKNTEEKRNQAQKEAQSDKRQKKRKRNVIKKIQSQMKPL